MTKKAPTASAENRELSTTELNSVSGGFNPQPDPPAKVSRPQENVSFNLAAVQVTYSR